MINKIFAGGDCAYDAKIKILNQNGTSDFVLKFDFRFKILFIIEF